MLGIALASGLLAHAHAGEFQYSVPPGWWDLLAPNPPELGRDMTRIPKPMLADAMSGRFAAFAVDPDSAARGGLLTFFTAMEAPGSGKVTLDEVNKAVAEAIDGFAAKGYKARLDEYSVFKLGGIPAGMAAIDVEGPAGSRMLRQYLIPGKKTLAVLTYSVPKYEYPAYLPAFEASARATKGAFNHGYSWERGLTAAGIGGGASALAYIFLQLIRRRRDRSARAEGAEGDETVSAPAPAAKKASQYVWNCPGCGKPVPMRLEQCRCGTAKPA